MSPYIVQLTLPPLDESKRCASFYDLQARSYRAEKWTSRAPRRACSAASGYDAAKCAIVNHLRTLGSRTLLGRGHAKARVWYPESVDIHRVDQVTFDTVEVCVGHIEFCLLREDNKARIGYGGHSPKRINATGPMAGNSGVLALDR